MISLGDLCLIFLSENHMWLVIGYLRTRTRKNNMAVINQRFPIINHTRKI